MIQPVKITLFGSSSILLVWDAKIDFRLSKKIIALNRLLKTEFQKEIIATHLAYHELVLYVDHHVDKMKFISVLERFINGLSTNMVNEKSVIFNIPVCYKGNFGWDIDEVCRSNHLTVEELIDLHSKPIYPIYFIGFLPGFPYLGGLNERLATPRKSSPRQKIQAGAVGIAGLQTGIYPIESPGGWNIIGKTPLKLFDVQQKPPTLLQPGNAIKFEPIDLATYNQIAKKIEKGSYTVEQYKNYD